MGRKWVAKAQGRLEWLFPKWTHRRRQHRWEQRWQNAQFGRFWGTDEPQKELVEAIESGWFPEKRRIIDVGCGNGQLSRWLAERGFSVLGLDYSEVAIENCRSLCAGLSNEPIFKVADLCREDLRLKPAFSVVDRGCFHRTVAKLRPVFARNIARATVEGGHFLLLASTFKDPRVRNYGGVRSEEQLRQHIRNIFGAYFAIERAEPAVINAVAGQRGMPAVAFWMVRKSAPLQHGECEEIGNRLDSLEGPTFRRQPEIAGA